MSNVHQLPEQKQDGSLTASEVLEAIPGLTYRQLDFWTRTKRIHALPGKAGSGRYRRYAPDQVEVARRMHKLLGLGFDFRTAHMLAHSQLHLHKTIFELTKMTEPRP